MTWEQALIIGNSASAIIVLWSAICAANHMTLKTAWLVRLAYILIGVGAAAVLLVPGYLGRTPSAAEGLLVTGLALYTLGNRRNTKSPSATTTVKPFV